MNNNSKGASDYINSQSSAMQQKKGKRIEDNLEGWESAEH